MLFISFIFILFIIYLIFEEDSNQQSTIMNPYVIAHRGASGYAPENTFAAFDKAVELKASYIELDVQMSADGELVVIHDPTINRTTNGAGAIKDLSLSEFKKFDAGSWFHPDFHAERIPTLKEVASRYSKKIGMLIELKDPFLYPGIERRLVEELKKEKLHKQKDNNVIIQSFDVSSIQKLHTMLPNIPKGLLTLSRLQESHLRRLSSFIQYVNMHYAVDDSNYLNLLKEKGFKSFIWTINHKKGFISAANHGANGIITDYPDILIENGTNNYYFLDNKDQFVAFIRKAYELFKELIS